MVVPFALDSIGLGVTGQLLFKVGAQMPVHTPGDLISNLVRPQTIVAFAMYAASIPLWQCRGTSSPKVNWWGATAQS